MAEASLSNPATTRISNLMKITSQHYLPTYTVLRTSALVNDKQFYDNGEKVVRDDRVHKQSHACEVVGAAAEATDADKAATEQVVDLPRISPGRGADLCGPRARRPHHRSEHNQRCAGHAPRPSLGKTKRHRYWHRRI